MKWYKHDSNANMDGKLQEILLDYGLEGYGLYWYCLELITGKVDRDNVTFQLEHDSRIIARNTGSSPQRVQEMMARFVDLGLFENTDGFITCLKLARRIDKSMTSNPEMREIIGNFNQNHDRVMTESAKPMQDKTRLEESKDLSPIGSVSQPVKKVDNCPHEQIANLYMEILPELPRVAKLTDKRKKSLGAAWRSDIKCQNLEFWEGYFKTISQSNFLMGRSSSWMADFDFVINQNKMIKIIEGAYE